MLTAFHDTGIQLQSQRMELDQANQLTDQTQREKSWLCEELEMRNKAFREDRARRCQGIEELRRICFTEAERARRFLPAACNTELVGYNRTRFLKIHLHQMNHHQHSWTFDKYGISSLRICTCGYRTDCGASQCVG